MRTGKFTSTILESQIMKRPIFSVRHLPSITWLIAGSVLLSSIHFGATAPTAPKARYMAKVTKLPASAAPA